MSRDNAPSISRDETLRSAERALAIALHLLEHRSVRRYDQSIQSLECPGIGRAVVEQALGLLVDLALDDAPTPDVMLDRLRRYELTAHLHTRYLGHLEAACVLAYMVLSYEHAASSFVRDFGDDESLMLAIARSSTFLLKVLREFNDGELPSMNGVPTPRIAVMIELERRSSANR